MQELKDQLAALEAQRIALEAAIIAAERAYKTDLVDSIRNMIHADGFDMDEIAGLIPIRVTRTPASKGNGAARASYGTRWALKDDPTCTYTRGPTPRWMLKRIEESGLDRKAFIAERMDKV